MLKSSRRKKVEKQRSQTMNTSSNTPTYIGPGVAIEGTLHSKAPLRIDGRVEGEIVVDEEVTIGESGIVEGPIKGSRIIIAGEVQGDIVVTDYLHVLPSGRLQGSTHTPRLIVEEGALFKGKSDMIGSEQNTDSIRRQGEHKSGETPTPTPPPKNSGPKASM